MTVVNIKSSVIFFVLYALVALSLPACIASPITPLCKAIAAGNTDRAIRLIARGADVNAGYGCALYAATSRGELELVKLLLENKADPNGSVSGDLPVIMGASTPLEAAVISRKIEMVKLLLEYGADPRNDYDAFTVVINLGDVEMADLLLRSGADQNMTQKPGKNVYAYKQLTPTHKQQVTVPPEDLEPDRIDETARTFQCDISGPESLLYSAVRPGAPGTETGRDSIAAMLLDKGADPHVKTLGGTNPLMFAASQQNHHLIKLLMLAGSDIMATDRCGRTAEDYATLYPRHQLAGMAEQTKALLQEYERH